MRVGIVGCGLIGCRRADVMRACGDELVVAADSDLTKAESLARVTGCQPSIDWQTVVDSDVDAVVVSTPNKYLAPIAVAALERGKHVLCEKPPGRNVEEASRIARAARQNGRFAKIGFNHRHHPALRRAHTLFEAGAIGPALFIRSVYGHGGRPGYENEWRGNRDLAGGGELLDQGVHVIDLCRWFLGDFLTAYAATPTLFWGKPPQEDNAFALLQTKDGRVAQWQTSWTQWKNRFNFEVFGRDGFLRVEGLGGSYGVETLTLGRRRPESGPPEEETIEFKGPDVSWQSEWDEFVSAIRAGRRPAADAEDGVEVMRTVAALYDSARTGLAMTV